MARLENQQSFAAEGMHIGSPYYTAPEQIANPENADERSDLYATGVLLYRMLTGELPAMKSFHAEPGQPAVRSRLGCFFYPGAELEAGTALPEYGGNVRRPDETGRAPGKEKETACRDAAPENNGSDRTALRDVPVRVSGDRARTVFKVNHLWQPRTYIRNGFADQDENVVRTQRPVLSGSAEPPTIRLTAGRLTNSLRPQ